MKIPLHFLIIDGYPKTRRDELEAAGMTLAWRLHAEMLLQHLPDAQYDILFPCDFDAVIPAEEDLGTYAGIIWTGSSLSINDTENPSIRKQIELAKLAFEKGVPSWGSCWGMQIAAVAAGGEVRPNPKGKEIGIARKIAQTTEALEHPMFEGKPRVFDAFCTHDDMVTSIPKGGILLAGNSFTHVQALAITHESGIFWGTQYHLEYNLHEMARLIVAYGNKLIEQGFFRDHGDLISHVDRMEALFKDPHRKDLRWQLAMHDDVLSDEVRQCEFINWIHKLVLPNATKSRPIT